VKDQSEVSRWGATAIATAKVVAKHDAKAKTQRRIPRSSRSDALLGKIVENDSGVRVCILDKRFHS
jgi:hypothetical protein